VSFFKIGALSFGGGPASISMMRDELTSNGDFTQQDFANSLAVGNALPGPITTNIAIFTGLKVGGVWAAILGVIGVIVPSCLIAFVIAWLFLVNHQMPLLQAALKGVRPAVVALLAYTTYKLVPVGIAGGTEVAICAVAFVSLMLWDINPAIAIILSGIVGIVLYR
jgi:chromate transporter